MEYSETDLRQPPVKNIDVEESDSSDNFQKFIYELFDKNGILNDLRAYLRGHIVNVLKGDPPLCQKLYTQRLELASQALNILIAEYLLRLEFTYSLSVFVSEIPLSNMVFDFAKNLFKGSDTSALRFKDNDVWAVLNYLGIQCDSVHALNIIELYRHDDNMPLLFCILKCMPMYRKEHIELPEDVSVDSLASSANSMDTLEEKRAKIHRKMSCHEKCKHYELCKTCRNRILKIKEKYKRRKEQFVENTTKLCKPINMENFMKNINVLEKSIIDEMFEQLKSVYEAEVEMVTQEQESRVKRSLATHALQLQQQREELEESLKTREAELESSAHQKRQFLWGVARTLREEHSHVARAMELVKNEQEVLVEKEKNLKIQISEAEESLRRKGEEMRIQISKELQVLDEQLEAVKRERDSLRKERSDFEDLKSLCDNRSRILEDQGRKEKEDLKHHYDLLKEELAVLKKYIDGKISKCVVEKGTITDFVEASTDSGILNNKHRIERNSRADVSDREVRPPNQLLNDLKKQKNVNFSQSNLEEVYRDVSISSVASEAVPVGDRDVIRRLIEENESLKDYARLQRDQMTALFSARAPNSATTARPATAPASASHYFTVHGVNPSTSANTFGWRKGAGEELSLFSNVPPRILHPGDPLPFVTAFRERHGDNRRHMINQWRALKRRSSPLAGVSKLRQQNPTRSMSRDISDSAEKNITTGFGFRITDDTMRNVIIAPDVCNENQECSEVSKFSKTNSKTRDKSPKTVLKEAKEKLRHKNRIKEKPTVDKRETSPTSMLREAKLRLRKLEIEAEAVERSYMDFRKRQAELKEQRNSLSILKDNLTNDDVIKNLAVNQSIKINDEVRFEVPVTPNKETNDLMKKDFGKYLLDYQTKFDIGELHFKNKNSVSKKVKPIPSAYCELNAKYNKSKDKSIDYLTTPIVEFRKLYHCDKERTSQPPKSNVIENFKDTEESDLIKKENVAVNFDNNEAKFEKLSSNLEEKITQEAANVELTKEIIKEKLEYEESNKINTVNNEIDIMTLSQNDKSGENENMIFTANETLETKNLEILQDNIINQPVELEVSKENINTILVVKSSNQSDLVIEDDFTIIKDVLSEANRDKNHEKRVENDINILRVEVESSCDVSKVKLSESQDDEMLIFVESSLNTKESNESEEVTKQPMTVIVCPKDNSRPKDWDINRILSPNSRSDSFEKSAQLAKNKSQSDANKDTSNEEKDIEAISSDIEKDSYDDYPDDFSADVDNYKSRSDVGNISPISLPKNSEDDNFWDN